MNASIRQIHPVFVGEVSGIDLSRPLSRGEVVAVEAGMDRYAVLVFRDQQITDEQQMAFSRNFGALEDARGGNITRPEDKRLTEGMNDVSNLGRDGQPLDRASRQRLMWDNRQMMHRVRRYDERQPRDMRRTTVAGDAPTTAQVEAA